MGRSLYDHLGGHDGLSLSYYQKLCQTEMDYQEAVAKTNQILDEERLNPTAGYIVNRGEVPDPFSAAIAVLILPEIRSAGPGQVVENPRRWVFESANYNLLCALLAQAPESSRATIVKATLSRIASAPACSKTTSDKYPNWNGFSSELPLVAEFCVRTGFRQDFFRVLGKAHPTVGHIMLLRQLRTMIALNFTVLTDEDYRHLDVSVG
jgi:hypothetical protein